MRFFRVLVGVAGAAAAFSAAGAAGAADTAQPATAAPARGVLVCEIDTASRRAFVRQYGERPVFIPALQALSVRSSDPAWSAPRCMTNVEYARYRQAANTFARAR